MFLFSDPKNLPYLVCFFYLFFTLSYRHFRSFSSKRMCYIKTPRTRCISDFHWLILDETRGWFTQDSSFWTFTLSSHMSSWPSSSQILGTVTLKNKSTLFMQYWHLYLIQVLLKLNILAFLITTFYKLCNPYHNP